MPLSPQPAEPQTTDTIETPTAPIETPVLETAPEATPIPETEPAKGSEVFVEGEPLPPGMLPVAETKQEAPAPPPPPHAAPIEIPKDPIQIKIDEIFERNVADAFGELQPLQQEAFRVVAETAATTVRALLSAPKVEPDKIRDVVAGVLRLLPETNPWWVEQEAALKTEALMALRA